MGEMTIRVGPLSGRCTPTISIGAGVADASRKNNTLSTRYNLIGGR